MSEPGGEGGRAGGPAGLRAGHLQLQRVPLFRLTGAGSLRWTDANSYPGCRGAWPAPPRPRCSCATGPCTGGEPGEAKPPCPHFPPKATRALHICLCGAMSQIDTFDYKPALIAAHGKPVNSSTKPDTFFGQIGRLRKPDWAFRQRGESGLWVSDLFPQPGRRWPTS